MPQEGSSTGGKDPFNLAIVGSGAAAFAAAIRASELGARVAMIEKGVLGGTCVNVGCIPSKTLLRAAEARFRSSHHGFLGIHGKPPDVDFGAVMRQKTDLVETLRHEKYENVLAAHPSITLLHGHARLLPEGGVQVDGRSLDAPKVLIATGAQPWIPPIPGLKEAGYLTNVEALALESLPARLIVLGGSAVGLEIAQLYQRLGSQVTVIEIMPRIAPAEDPDVGEDLAHYLREEGMTVITGTTVKGVLRSRGCYRVQTDSTSWAKSVEADQLLVAAGRRSTTQGMGLEKAGVRLGRKGEVVVNDYLESTRSGVYAGGDVLGDPMFVYVAAYGGMIAAENAIEGNRRRYDLAAVPRVTFTDPQMASVGLTIEQATREGLKAVEAKLPLSYVPRALAARDTRGFIKLVAEERTGRILGAHILAPEAGEIVMEPALAIRYGLTVDQIASAFHPYLTHAEGIKLAAQTFEKDVSKLSCCAA